jgi:hypothetical protein
MYINAKPFAFIAVLPITWLMGMLKLKVIKNYIIYLLKRLLRRK